MGDSIKVIDDCRNIDLITSIYSAITKDINMADDNNVLVDNVAKTKDTSNNGYDSSEPPCKKLKEDVHVGESANNESETRGKLISQVSDEPGETNTEQTAISQIGDAPPTAKLLTERDVGICEYVGKQVTGFSGVIKQRYSDFLVNEIDMDGSVVNLNDISTPPEKSSNVPDTLKVLGQEMIDRLKSLAEIEGLKSEPFTLDVEIMSKEERRAIHESVRALFPALDTNTEEAGGRKVITVVRRSGSVAGGRPNDTSTFQKGRRQTWPSGRGNYAHFALHKENIDTLEAVNLVSRFLRMKANVFSYAGVKDKRAKTVQQISVYRTDASKLLDLNKRLRNMLVGNVRYLDRPLQLGDLSGNRFRIVLRNVGGTREQIEEALRSLSERGFVNYYGMQRFGTTSVPTHRVGLALVRSQWSEAVELIMRSRSGEDANMTECRRLWAETQDAKQVLRLLRRQSSIEAHLLRGLDKHGKRDLVNALGMIPRNMRLMYVHSYQSYIWNWVVSRRLQKYGQDVIAGDLLLNRKGLRENGIVDGVETAPTCTADPDKPANDRARPPKPIPTKVKPGEELTSSIDDVVLPLPGHDILYPDNEIMDWYKELLAKDDVTMQHFNHRVKDYALCGSYRHAFVHPTHVTWDLTRYDDPDVALLLSDKDVLEGTSLPSDAGSGERLAVRLQFDLPPSCYATMALREVLRADTSAAHQSTLNIRVTSAGKSNESIKLCTEETS